MLDAEESDGRRAEPNTVREEGLHRTHMLTSTENQPMVDPQIWNAWVEKRNRREEVSARRLKMFAGIAAVLLVVGSTLYILAGR